MVIPRDCDEIQVMSKLAVPVSEQIMINDPESIMNFKLPQIQSWLRLTAEWTRQQIQKI